MPLSSSRVVTPKKEGSLFRKHDYGQGMKIKQTLSIFVCISGLGNRTLGVSAAFRRINFEFGMKSGSDKIYGYPSMFRIFS